MRLLQEPFLPMSFLFVRVSFHHLRCLASDQYLCLPVTYIPTWFPGAQWKRKAQAWRKDMDALCDVPFNYAKAQIVGLIEQAVQVMSIYSLLLRVPE